MADVDVETFAWLLTDDGQRVLAEAAAGVGEGVDDLPLLTRLRATTTAARAAAAVGQARLRVQAETKFGADAARMYFTRDALEQATRARVATHRAARLAMAGPQSVVDLGCSIGGDLLALARAGLTAAGVELDPVRAALARANLAALDLGGAVLVADATTLDLAPFDVAFADPARRGRRGRTFSVDEWTPPWPFVESLLARPACVKTAPGLPHSLVPPGVEAEWVSDDGEVKEAALWSGWLATTARRATVIGPGGLATLTEDDLPDGGCGVREVGAYLYEPDGAVIRAGLVQAVAAGVGGGLLEEHTAYVTSDQAFTTPFATTYEVVEQLPYREKALRAALRERGVGRLTIKKRGVSVVPESLRQRLALAGDHEATIVLTRVAGRGGVCLSVRPL